jgi:hypothetical protein
VPFPGLAYCNGGRSLYWGGWSPELLGSELPAVAWPKAVVDDLKAKTLPDGSPGYFQQSSDQIGVTETNDFIFGALQEAMRAQLAKKVGTVTDAMPLTPLPDHPAVRYARSPLTDEDLEQLLGRKPSATPPPRQDLLDELKLEAPLAVQGQSGHAGFFPFNKFSSVPLLIKAAREAGAESNFDDVKKRLMIVPNCHVNRLITVKEGGELRVAGVETNHGIAWLPQTGKVIIALGTVESTRLALASFGDLDGTAYNRIGKNLMAHLRSNLDVRIPRAALSSLSPAVKALQAGALFVKGQHTFGDGTVGHFHLQITAAGLGAVGANSEAELFKKIPDIDKYNSHRFATDTHVVVTIRGIGEMESNNPDSHVTLDMNPAEEEFGVRRAFVSIKPSARDMELWVAMDKASDDAARIFANGNNVDVIVRGNVKATNVNPANLAQVLPYRIKDPNDATKDINNPERRDGLGTTHHEAGTLRMGSNAATSVTDANAKFHGVKNAYALGPAVFPTIGSPNPMLTGIAMARRLADHLCPPPPAPVAEPGFNYIFDGSPAQLNQWKTVGPAKFIPVNRALVAEPNGDLGLLYFAGQKFENFVLRLNFLLQQPQGPRNDNSGVFVRFRDPTQPVPDPNNPAVTYPYNNPAWVAVTTGYEIQIDEEARGDSRINEPDGQFYNRTGAIYKIQSLGSGPGQQNYSAPQPLAPDRWHTYEVEVKGDDYIVRLNGQETTRFKRHATDKSRGNPPSVDPMSGFIGLQAHTGRVAFANVRVKALP